MVSFNIIRGTSVVRSRQWHLPLATTHIIQMPSHKALALGVVLLMLPGNGFVARVISSPNGESITT